MQKIFLPCLLTLSLFATARFAHAASDATFHITSNSSGSQYDLGSGQTGTVDANKTLSYSGDKALITVDNSSGNSSPISITNSGTINETATDSDQSGRAIRLTGNNINLTLTNNVGATIETANADVIQANISNSPTTAIIDIENYGVINAQNTPEQTTNFNGGQQAIDLNKLTGGSFTLNNYGGAAIEALESDAIQVPTGGTINITNYGLIQSTHGVTTGGTVSTSTSDAINGEETSGIVVDNDYGLTGQAASTPATLTTSAVANTASIIGAHHGITADGSGATSSSHFTMTINNGANGVIEGKDGSGVNIDGTNAYELVTINNAGLIEGDGISGDGDGVDVDGLVNLDNSGTIKSLNALNDTSEGVTVGGGTITNESTGVIEGDAGKAGVGITLAGLDSNGGTIVNQTMGDSVVKNYGTITGANGAGIQATGNQPGTLYAVTIYNYDKAVINGSGSGAAVALGENDDVFYNYGIINANGTGGAVDMGTGHNEFDVIGGDAAVNGNISGGTGSTNSLMQVEAGSGGVFAYSHTISNFANVQVASGTFKLDGTVTGGTTTIQSGATLTGTSTLGAVAVAAGGMLSPGDSVGQASATSLSLAGTGTFLFQTNSDGTGTAGTNWDQFLVSGNVDVTNLSSSNQFVFDLQSVNGSNQPGALPSFDEYTNHIWKNVLTSTGFTGSLTSSDFTVNTSQFDETLDGTFSVMLDGTNLDLVYTAAPEPSTWAMLLGGAGLVFGLTRFRKRLL